MSCWVVPQVAAEIWGVHVDRIWNAVRDGVLKTMEENGWMFVDVAPDSPRLETATARWAGSPWTQQVISQAEHDALNEPLVEQEQIIENPAVEILAEQSEQVELVEELADIDQPVEMDEELEVVGVISGNLGDSDVAVDEQDDSIMLSDFRKTRNQVARTRIPPMAQAA